MITDTDKFQFMKKYIANIITCSRVAFSLLLLFIPLSSGWFCTFYLFCGISDMVDGAIARKMGAVSKFGASLDTIADLVFMFVCSIRLLPLIHMPVWIVVWIVIIAGIKMFNIVFVFIRRKELISIHSVLNKITGFALFLLPLSMTFVENTYCVVTICVLATVAVIQEVYCAVRGKEVL